MRKLTILNNKLTTKEEQKYVGSLTEATKKAYTRDIMDFFGVNSLTDITVEAIQSVDVARAMSFRENLKEQGREISTINRKLTSLSNFYSFLCRREVGLMDYNPFSSQEGLARFKYNKNYSNTKCLTVEEVQALVKVVMTGTDIESIRNRIIILLLATTGLRRSELSSVKLGDILFTQGQYVIEITGKYEKQRLIVVDTLVKAMIDEYISARGLTYKDKSDNLLVSHSYNPNFNGKPLSDKTIYNVVKKVSKEAGLDADSISPHCLRHTFITEALDSGVSLQDVQDMSGHSDPSTTRRYDHSRRMIKNSPASLLTNKFLQV